MPAKILVVEDNPANRELMDYLLRAAGYEPILAEGGSEGIRLFESGRPDLVLLDIQMPDLDGVEVIRTIRPEPGGDPPVLAVTAFAMVGDRDRLLSAGFDGYIAKPIEAESFVSQVEAHIGNELRAHRGSGAPW